MTDNGLRPGAGTAASDPLPVPFSRRLTARHWTGLDVGLAVLLAVGSAASIASGHGSGPAFHGAVDVVRYLAVVLACLPLPLRRRYPLAVLATTVAADALLIGLGSRVPAHLVVGFAMYTVAAASPARVPLSLVGAAVTPVVVATLARDAGRNVQTLIFSPAVIVVGWLAGENTRARRAYAAGMAERTAERERERARQAAAEERARIARELHDVVAHAMSVVAVRSGVARMVLDSRPEEAAEALGIIEGVSRRGLAELRRIVGVLRSSDDARSEQGQMSAAADLAPAPGLADLPTLVDDVVRTGVHVELRIEGIRRALPAGEDLSAFRIAQEALTNVVRHAGPGASAALSVRYSASAVEIECVDDGGGRAAPPEPGEGGHGLIGMRERVALYGGHLSVGPAGRGFRVQARLPVTEEAR